MGDDLSQGMRLGATLVILCSILFIVISLLMMMKNITNTGSSTLQSGLDQMLQTKYNDYDQQQLSGTQVSAALKLFESEKVAIVIKTSSCQSSGSTTKGGYNYGAILEGYTKGASAQDGDIYTASTDITTKKKSGDSFYTINRDVSSGAIIYNKNTRPVTRSGVETYLRTSAWFLAELIKDSTDEVVGICFTQTA